VQLRFLKARLQIELRDTVSAKNTWVEITQQFPELPEPYNNLAALSANQGKWIEARDYLELALKLRPDYVTAQGNLAEVYLRLSETNYLSASKLQPNQREYGLRAKAIKEILNPVAKPANRSTTSPSTNPNSATPKP
ncbi:MAG: tetratricopeptide repeat protein, partial [Burkholderiaceae bacterium]|nr:tetratricopeptide repeat protein [Burkholderiaceae bacterium]